MADIDEEVVEPVVEEVVEPIVDEPVVEEKTIDEREEEIQLRENTISATGALKKDGIPVELLDFVLDGDATKQTEKISSLSKVWKAALKTAIKERVAGDPPRKSGRFESLKPFRELSYKERLKLKRTNPDAYAQIVKR